MPIYISPYATSHFKGGCLETNGVAPQAACRPADLCTECVRVYVCERMYMPVVYCLCGIIVAHLFGTWKILQVSPRYTWTQNIQMHHTDHIRVLSVPEMVTYID